MKTIDKIINEFAGEVSSLNDDYLTWKELDRMQEFLSDLCLKNEYFDGKEIYINHPDWVIKECTGLINNLRSYIDSLKLKIKIRENIPRWYQMNKC